jgi:hypothetical protein
MLRAGEVMGFVSMRRVAVLIAGAFLALFAAKAEAAVSVHIDQSSQRMTVRANGETVGVWAVSTARIGARTPNGTFRPYMLSRNHRSSIYNNAPMPYSVFFRGNYAIHGTNQLSRLGSPASAGCIRLHPDNARVLFELVQRHGMRNVSISITGATGGYAVAQAAQRRQRVATQQTSQRRVAQQQQRARVAQQQTRTRAATAPRQQVRPAAAAAVSRTPTTVYATSPNYDLRGLSN